MRSLSHERCFNHSLREAAARCPQCRQCYCRECITEHDGRVIWAACLQRLVGVPLTRRSGFVGMMRAWQLLLGLATIWLFFYLLGETLLSVPSSFHDGAVWKPNWLAEP